MNKNEIGILISQKLENEITKKDIASVLNAFIEVSKEILVKGDRITLEGFLSLGTMVINKKVGCCFGNNWSTPKKYTPSVRFSDSFKKLIATKKV